MPGPVRWAIIVLRLVRLPRLHQRKLAAEAQRHPSIAIGVPLGRRTLPFSLCGFPDAQSGDSSDFGFRHEFGWRGSGMWSLASDMVGEMTR